MAVKVYIRADGGSEIGLGHLVRCIALAHMIKNSFGLIFVCRQIPQQIIQELYNSNFDLVQIESETSFFERLNKKDIVVLDGYNFDTEYQKSVKAIGCKLVCIDDLHDKEFVADLIINHAPGIAPSDYKAQVYTRYALGLDYVLLRPVFLKQYKKNNQDTKTLLICLGGSDEKNETLKVLKLVSDNSFFKINVVLGASYLFQNEINNYIKNQCLPDKVKVYYSISEVMLATIMRQCGVAICSPSTISLEYLSVTKGKLLLILTADNQSQWYNFALSQKLAYEFSIDNFKAVKRLKSNYILQNKLFDGLQKQRYIELFKTI